MKKQLPAWIVLGLIAIIAGALLGMTNQLTMGPIEEQTIAAANAARVAVLPGAEEFEELACGAPVDSFYAGKAGGQVVGHTAQITVQGYGGPIEITIGVDTAGVLTGVSIGGADFAETAGLGAKVKEAPFMEQFKGLTEPVAIGGNIDAVTAATISSTAVANGVNTAWDYILENAG